nr:schlafen family member 5 isoform X1 [Meriones unguiculatus]
MVFIFLGFRKRLLLQAEKMSFLASLEMNFSEYIVDGGRATLGVRQRVEMDPAHRERQNEVISKAVCALLNSGGGMVRVEIENRDYNSECDGVGLNLPPLFRNHLDEMQQGELFLIYVNSWNVAHSGVPLATLCSNLYHRCGRFNEVMDPPEALLFLRRRVEALRNDGDPDLVNPQEASVDNHMISAAGLFEGWQLQYLQKLNFAESLHVDFQMFSADLSQGLKERLPVCVSALANSEGGYVFFGVHDKTCQVIGCEKEKLNPSTLLATIDGCIRKMPVYHFCAQDHKVQYEVKFLEVYEKEALYGYVCAIKVERFCCAVFAKAPDSWEIKDNHTKQIATKDWLAWMVETDPELYSFPQLTLARSVLGTTPKSRPVFKHTSLRGVEELQKDYFPVSPNRITYTPESIYRDLFSDHRGLRNLINSEMRCFSQGVLVFSHSWAVDLGLPRKQGVICDALLISPNNVPILYTICSQWTLEYKSYSMKVARTLKEQLVNVGGYIGRLGIIPLVLQLGSDQPVRPSLEMPVYPESYNFTTVEEMEELLQSLVIVLFGFRFFSNEELPSEIMMLLTDQQYQLVSKNLCKCGELFVHGLPGSGKTTLALRIMEKIRNVFSCQANNILYICGNQALTRFMSKKNLCQAVTQKNFMKKTFNNIEHIVVDEAQNFRTEDGDWYAKAKSIVKTRRGDPGVLCIFLDYFLINHLCCSGLPSLQQQNQVLFLTRMLRNGDNITNYLQHIIQQIRENPPVNVPPEALRLGQEPEWVLPDTGSLEITDDLSLEQMASYIAEKCRCLWRSGYDPRDVAVLFTNTRNIDKCKDKILLAMRRRTASQLSEEPSSLVQVREGLDILGNHIVFERVHRFSGLERSIVFGVIPVASDTTIFYNVLLCLASRARTHLYIIKLSDC